MDEMWTKVASGDLEALGEVLGSVATVRLVQEGEEIAGPAARDAWSSLRRTMPDLKVSGTASGDGAWLQLTGMPWLPDRTLHAAIRQNGDALEIVGLGAQLLAQALRKPSDEATLAPTFVHPNALILRAGYDDPSIHAKIFTDDFVAHTLGDNPTAGDWHGAGEMAEHLKRIRALSGDTMKVAPLTPFSWANDGFGITFSRAVATRGDASLDQYVCGVWRFEDGKIAEHWELFSEPQKRDAFWNAPEGTA